MAASVATKLITHRVARKACRSHVESGTNPAESATELFTELLWKRSGCGKSTLSKLWVGRLAEQLSSTGFLQLREGLRSDLGEGF